MSDKTLYFAYGSNINLEQMAERCPDATPVGPVTLEGYELQFRGGGFATIAPCEGSQVQGLLWKLTPRCECRLDIYEGCPRVYEKQMVTVRDGQSRDLQVMAYVMTGERSKTPCMPSRYYYAGIAEGLRQNNMPLEPLEQAFQKLAAELQAARSQAPDSNRHPKQQNKKRYGKER